MKVKSKKKIKGKGIIIIFLFALLVLIFLGTKIIKDNIKAQQFVQSYINTYEENEEEVFKIEKIVLCSSANAIDLSAEQNLQNLSIYQYTDIAIYIENGEELANKNTVKELYIDSITFKSESNVGIKGLTYKNILEFGSKTTIKEIGENERIDFNIIYTNSEESAANYDEATFYTDCSNPITLEYLNYNVATNYSMAENKTVAFDGSLLEDAEVATQDLDCKVIFRINIINNNDEYYSCWVNFQIPLDDIYNGTTMKATTITNNKYAFFKHVNAS